MALAAALVALPAGLLVARWVEQGTRLTSEYPASWQMYSAAAVPTYTGVYAAGREVPLEDRFQAGQWS